MILKTALDFVRPTLVGSPFATEAQSWRMLDKVSHIAPYLAITPVILLISALEWNNGTVPYARIWAITSIALLAFRFWLYRAYVTRSSSDRVSKWRNLLAFAVVIAGVQFGFGGFLIIDAKNPLTENAVIGLIICCIAAAATRLHVMPKAVIAQAIVCVSVASIGSIMAGRWEFVGILWTGCAYIVVFIRSLATLEAGRLADEREKMRLLETLAASNEALAAANARLGELALTDALTQLPNRRAFDRKLDEVAAMSTHHAASMTVLVMDIDHFKSFNDSYGHHAGDRCLALVGAALKAAVGRRGDLVARYGGEEFAAILPFTTETQAATIAEGIRQAVETADLSGLPGKPARVSLSIGVAATVPTRGFAPADLVAHADRALYRAKQRGRNRVELAGDGHLPISPAAQVA